MITFAVNIKKMQYLSETVGDLKNIVTDILMKTNAKVFAMYGSMGAGKTTITKAFCDELKVVDVVNSPTFAIINEYMTADGDNIFHFDCYRLKSISEFIDIGGEDYLYSGSYCFIEWAEIIEELIPEDAIKLYIKPNNLGNNRIITLNDSYFAQ